MADYSSSVSQPIAHGSFSRWWAKARTSFFWIVLIALVLRLGYDRRALKLWTGLGGVLCLVAFFLLPPAGAILADPKWPRDVNYVFGLDEAHPQSWMPPGLYLVVWYLALFTLAYVPTHLALAKLIPARATRQPL